MWAMRTCQEMAFMARRSDMCGMRGGVVALGVEQIGQGVEVILGQRLENIEQRAHPLPKLAGDRQADLVQPRQLGLGDALGLAKE